MFHSFESMVSFVVYITTGKFLSLGGKIYDDMLSRNRLYSKEELRSRLSSGDAHKKYSKEC